MKWEYFVNEAEKLFGPYMENEYSEYMDEMKGMADGAREAGVNITWQEILTWNGYE